MTHLLTAKAEHVIALRKQTALQEKCLSENTLYQADTSSENFQTKICYDISEAKFKTRFSNVKKSFSHEKHKNDTQLSNELRNINPF